MGKWNEFKDGQYPRKGEIIVVKNADKKFDEENPPIYPYLLICESSMDYWRYPELGHGTKLSFHGLTHWQLIESPY